MNESLLPYDSNSLIDTKKTSAEVFFVSIVYRSDRYQKVYRTPTSALHFVAMSASKVLV